MLILFHMYYFFVGRGASVLVQFSKFLIIFSNIIFFLILDQQNKVQEFLVLGSQVKALYDFD